MTEKEFNDVIEKLARAKNKSFSEMLRELCTKAGIPFKLLLNAQEKRMVLKSALDDQLFSELFPPEFVEKVKKFVEGGRRRKKQEGEGG